MVSIFIENLPDSISGYQLGLTMDRPDVGVFETVLDQTGTLTEDWGGSVSMFSSYDARITSGTGSPPNWSPIPPITSGTLVRIAVTLYCDIPDTMQDRFLGIHISPVNTAFSTPRGELIVPLDFTPGSVTADLGCPYQGDIEPDGFITPLDLSGMISALYEGGPNPHETCCPTFRFDFDCDGFVTSLDMGIMIDYLFASGPGPCTPLWNK
jgi:hypothetical protein